MLLDLVVAELEDLQFVREGRLRGLCLCEEVHDLSICKGLLYVLVVKVDDSVAIREGLPLDTVIEDDLFLAVLIDPLNLTIVANILLDHFLVRQSFVMVLLGELEAEVLFVVRTHIVAIVATLFGRSILDCLTDVAILLSSSVGDGTSAVWHSVKVIVDLISLLILQIFLVFILIVSILGSWLRMDLIGKRKIIEVVVLLLQLLRYLFVFIVLLSEEHLVFDFAESVIPPVDSLTNATTLVVKGVSTLIRLLFGLINGSAGVVVVSRLGRASPLQNDPLLLHGPQIFSQFLVFLLQLIVLLGKSLDLTLLLLCLQLSIGSVLVVLSAEGVDLFAFLLCRGRH